MLIGPVHDVVVAPSGAAAYVAGGSQPVVGQMTEAGGQQLESGAGVQPDSLALSEGGQLYWTNAALPRSFRLDDTPARAPKPTSFGGHARCYPRKSQTEAASTRIRVYWRTVEDGDEMQFVACDLRSGRRIELAQILLDYDGWALDKVAMAGSFLAISERSSTKYSRGQAASIRSWDMATGAPGFSSPPLNHWASVTSLVLEPDGSIGWITDERPDYQDAHGPYSVKRCDSGGCVQLEKGQGVDGTSMALSRGSHLYWTSGGQPRAATLD